MKHTRNGDRVQLDMTLDEWENFLMMLGFAAGMAQTRDIGLFWHWIDFANRVNEGNAEFTPYKILDEFRRSN